MEMATMKSSPEIVSAMLARIYDHATSEHKDSWEAAAWLLRARKNGWIIRGALGGDSEQRWRNVEKIARLGTNGGQRPGPA